MSCRFCHFAVLSFVAPLPAISLRPYWFSIPPISPFYRTYWFCHLPRLSIFGPARFTILRIVPSIQFYHFNQFSRLMTHKILTALRFLPSFRPYWFPHFYRFYPPSGYPRNSGGYLIRMVPCLVRKVAPPGAHFRISRGNPAHRLNRSAHIPPLALEAQPDGYII